MQIYRLFISRERSLIKVAKHGSRCLHWSSHAREYIGQEKVSEPYFSERCYEYVSETLGDLYSTSEVKAVEWLHTNEYKWNQENYGEVGRGWVELERQFDHGYLPDEAEKPDKGENKSHSVQLVVN